MTDGQFFEAVMVVIKSAQSFIDADGAHGADHRLTLQAKELLADALEALMPNNVDPPVLHVIRGEQDDEA